MDRLQVESRPAGGGVQVPQRPRLLRGAEGSDGQAPRPERGDSQARQGHHARKPQGDERAERWRDPGRTMEQACNDTRTSAGELDEDDDQ